MTRGSRCRCRIFLFENYGLLLFSYYIFNLWPCPACDLFSKLWLRSAVFYSKREWLTEANVSGPSATGNIRRFEQLEFLRMYVCQWTTQDKRPAVVQLNEV